MRKNNSSLRDIAIRQSPALSHACLQTIPVCSSISNRSCSHPRWCDSVTSTTCRIPQSASGLRLPAKADLSPGLVPPVLQSGVLSTMRITGTVYGSCLLLYDGSVTTRKSQALHFSLNPPILTSVRAKVLAECFPVLESKDVFQHTTSPCICPSSSCPFGVLAKLKRKHSDLDCINPSNTQHFYAIYKHYFGPGS